MENLGQKNLKAHGQSKYHHLVNSISIKFNYSTGPDEKNTLVDSFHGSRLRILAESRFQNHNCGRSDLPPGYAVTGGRLQSLQWRSAGGITKKTTDTTWKSLSFGIVSTTLLYSPALL